MVRSISSVVFLFINAFASTASSLVGNLIGAGEADRVWGLCRRRGGRWFAAAARIGGRRKGHGRIF